MAAAQRSRLWVWRITLLVALLGPFVYAGALIWLSPSVWVRAREGTLIGRSVDRLTWTRGVESRDSSSWLPGWDVSFTRGDGYSIDDVQVAAVRLDAKRTITACGYFEINTDVPSHLIIRSQTVWPKDAPGLTFE